MIRAIILKLRTESDIIHLSSVRGLLWRLLQVSEAPIGFLTKPLKRAEMEATFGHIVEVIGDGGTFYHFSYNREEYKLPVRDILYFEKQLRKIHIVSVDQQYYEYRSLEEIKADLDRKKRTVSADT